MLNNKKNLNIGMFDSGVGGLTVLREMKSVHPNHNYIYFGDTARCPYGNKSKETIDRYSLENGSFLINQGIDILIIACITATSHSLQNLREKFNIPVIGVVEPAARHAASKTKNGHIGIIGTKGTIRSGAYERAIKKHLPTASFTSVACPLFVPLIEAECSNPEVLRLVVQDSLKPFKDSNIDTLILGCTHYPLISYYIQKEIGKKVTLINPAEALSDEIGTILPSSDKENLQTLQFYVSDDPELFRSIGEKFFGISLPEIHMAIPNQV